MTEDRNSVRIEAVRPVLMSRDVEASLAFFARLGFRELFRDRPTSPRYAVVARDAAQLHLQWADASQWAGSADRPTYRFLVSDVDALYAQFVDTCPDLLAPPSRTPWAAPGDTPWATREFHLRDPDGNGLQFYRVGAPDLR